ncbi:DUF3149 domain-containing protein [Undibacterium cyanobacteriorum]|uniref:DUF3149 domain-containing protein n=1 Tax=Undibacterium cyanobacteriorum TaxID=3073561 RepID=A0ABY9RMI0_9BURK|nr:DUF3149 domain-containing protein [Undibacterium sp. 20NA77.5]WMW82093.1 DUF3149 domain-containing protein [Undibacterium sp. 20NA77.5]
MKLLSGLLSTDYGLMSLAVILFVIGMAVFFIRYFLRNLEEEAKRDQQQ